jgi:hypothetical protein
MDKSIPTILTNPIGVCVVAKADINQNNSAIRLFSESGCDEGAYFPACDIHIYGDRQIEALHKFLEEVIAKRKEYK